MLTRFVAKNYRNVECDVALGRVNVVIGPNNSGKTNFLRGLRFAGDLLERVAQPGRHLIETIDLHGGMNLARRGTRGPVDLRWDWTDGAYEIAFSPEGRVVRERLEPGYLAHGAQPGTVALASRPGAAIPTVETNSILHEGFNDKGFLLPVVAADDRQRVVAALSTGVVLRRFSGINPGDVARPTVAATSGGILDERAEQLINVLRELEQSEDQSSWEELTERLREVLPDLKRLWVKDSGGTHRWASLNFGKNQDFALSQMSDGTVLILALATLLAAPTQLQTLILDEPELNLHPAWLRVVGGWLQRTPKQIVVSTHSPDLLDTFTDGFRNGEVKVFVFARPSSDAPAVRTLDPHALAPFLENWDLGDLYRVGEPKVGGWPW